MSFFTKKTWKDRIAEYPTRRRLTKEDGSAELVTVAREEGTISVEGDAFSAENMNDLEKRVEDGFDEVTQSFAQVALVNRGVLPTGADVNRLNRNDAKALTENSIYELNGAKALTENSIYELNGANTYSNLPAGVKWGFIEVVKCSGFVLERVITNNDLFMRILANSAWGNWWGYFTSTEIEAKHQTSVKMVTVSDLPVNKNTFQQTYKAHGLNVNKITSVESFVDGDSHCHVTKCWVDGSVLRWNVSNESDSVAVVTVGAYVRYLK